MNEETFRRGSYWALLAPALIFLCFALVVPLLFLFRASVMEFDTFKGVLPELTAENYLKVLGDPYYLQTLLRTIRISLVATLACVLLAYPLAYYFVFYAAGRRGLILIGLLSPLFVSALVRTYGWMVILGQGGPIEAILIMTGIWDRPGRIINTEFAIIVGFVHLFLALMVLSIATALQNIQPDVLRAARITGATAWQTFLRVTLPLSLPGVISGSAIVFSLCAGAFITPAILGGLRVRVMSFAIYEEFSIMHNYAFGSVLAMTLMIGVGVIVYLSMRLANSREA